MNNKFFITLIFVLVLTSFASAYNPVQKPCDTSGLKALWSLNESGSDSVAVDCSVNSKNLTGVNIGSGDWVAGMFNNSVDLDGSSEYFSGSNGDDHFISEDIIVLDFWIYPNDDFDVVSTDTAFFSDFATSGDAGGFLFKVDSDNTNKLQFATWSDGADLDTIYCDKTSWNANEWYHIYFEWNGTDIFCFVNGVNETPASNSFGSNMGNTISSYPFGMGTSLTPSANQYFDGLMDDVAIYNVSLLNSSKGMDCSNTSVLGNGTTGWCYEGVVSEVFYVNLTSPVNGSTVSTVNNTLSYNLTGDWNTSNNATCDLYINGVFNQTDIIVPEPVTTVYNQTFDGLTPDAQLAGQDSWTAEGTSSNVVVQDDTLTGYTGNYVTTSQLGNGVRSIDATSGLINVSFRASKTGGAGTGGFGLEVYNGTTKVAGIRSSFSTPTSFSCWNGTSGSTGAYVPFGVSSATANDYSFLINTNTLTYDVYSNNVLVCDDYPIDSGVTAIDIIKTTRASTPRLNILDNILIQKIEWTNHQQFTLTDVADGTYDWSVNCTDILNNTASSQNFTYFIDTRVINTPSEVDTTVGTLTGGDVLSLRYDDTNYYNVSEVVGTPAFNISINFTLFNVTDSLRILGEYVGSPVHVVNVDAWNGSSWNTLGTIPDNGGISNNSYVLGSEYNVSGVVQLEIVHTSAGNINHDLILDFIELQPLILDSNVTNVDLLSTDSCAISTPLEVNGTFDCVGDTNCSGNFSHNIRV